MTAFAEKMESAGVDTIGAKLTMACIEGIKHHPDNLASAWRYAGAIFGQEFIRALIKDMDGPKKAAPELPVAAPMPRYEYQKKEDNRSFSMAFPQPAYKPRVVSSERIERRNNLREIVRSKYKNSAGISWSDVGWYELISLDRDGREAAALLSAGPAHVPNDGRTVGQVLGVEKIDAIIQRTREA